MTTIKIKTIINGKEVEANAREFLGMYQIVDGPYACGIVRKEDVL